MEPWVLRSDFAAIVEIPDSVTLARYNPWFNRVLRGWFKRIVGPQRYTDYENWLIKDGRNETIQPYAEMEKLVTPFLVYATMALWVPENNLHNTVSGLREKSSPDSNAMEDRQRTEIRIQYEGLAKSAAEDLAEYLAAPNRCNAPSMGQGNQFSSVRSQQGSYFSGERPRAHRHYREHNG